MVIAAPIMWRMRRSRIIVALAVFTLFLLFHFKSIPDQWSTAGGRLQRPASSPGKEDTEGKPRPKANAAAPQRVTTTAAAVALQEHKTAANPAPQGAPGLVFDTRPAPPAPQATHGEQAKPENVGLAKQQAGPIQTVAGTAAGGPDVFGLKTTATTSSEIHWTRLPEHFPVPSDSIIPLPTGQSKKIPKIQHDFKDETPFERAEREQRQKRIKEVFKKSWKGYTEHAWLHDELRPLSGKYNDPFCGWAATLVDSLDSLVIMGLEGEFKEALQGLESIDFTTTARKEIPVFETTIRYLGGLLSAYDLSPHEILLNKAVELAEVLMGAFDTPNRMPQTFYQWMPTFMEQPKRAKTRVVMAELGSLSMEFTRLAQITKKNKYYDAIARITNEFDIWQNNTRMPGLWPLYVDASGCKKSNTVHSDDWEQKLMNGHRHGRPEILTTIVARPQAEATQRPAPAQPAQAGRGDSQAGVAHKAGKIKNWDGAPRDTSEDAPENAAKKPAPVAASGQKTEPAKKGKIKNWGTTEVNMSEGKVPTRQMESAIMKRQLDNVPEGLPRHNHGENSSDDYDQYEPGPLGSDLSVRAPPGAAEVQCIPQDLASPPGETREEFSFGGMADSTYEYLPKQFLLLGGQVPQYQKMYEKAIDTANKHLLFRAMTPDETDILVLGKGDASNDFEKPGNFRLEPILSHLLCFTGGMYGMASRIFDRPEELEIAKKMTDACVWAYNATNTGIMPEDMFLMPCDNMKSCPWNQTAWEYELDPYPEIRMKDGLTLMRPLKPGPNGNPSTKAPSDKGRAPARNNRPPVAKRQLGEIEHDSQLGHKMGAGQGEGDGRGANRMEYLDHKNTQGKQMASPGTNSLSDEAPLNQKEYVKAVMEIKRLPKGIPSITSKKYILRPEAIESVFYMYRLTGDPIWREKGWRMFEAVEKATDAEFGASAITDVMDDPDDTYKTDSMESFWLAETLKYFYLLFSTEDTISLDEWVLNTEAHPFKRPQ